MILFMASNSFGEESLNLLAFGENALPTAVFKVDLFLALLETILASL